MDGPRPPESFAHLLLAAIRRHQGKAIAQVYHTKTKSLSGPKDTSLLRNLLFLSGPGVQTGIQAPLTFSI
jgi:hypothetical protein